MPSFSKILRSLHDLPSLERQVKALEMFETHPSSVKTALLSLSCVWGDKSSVQAMLKKNPELLNQPVSIASFLPKSYSCWIYTKNLSCLYHAFSAKQSDIALYLLKQPNIEVNLDTFNADSTDWNTLLIASLFLDNDSKRGRILKALIDKGESPLVKPLKTFYGMTALETSIESLDTRAMKVFLSHPSFSWSKISQENVERIDGLLSNEVDNLGRYLQDEQLGFQVFTNPEKKRVKNWIKIFLDASMPEKQYPMLRELINLFPEVEIEHNQALLEKSIPKAPNPSYKIKTRL